MSEGDVRHSRPPSLTVVRSGDVAAGETCRMPASVTSLTVFRVTLDEAYQARALQITEFRLAQAGIRLASTLNRIWCWAEFDA